MSAGALNVNVACLACDGTRPCAQCRAVGKALAGAGHRVHRSSRYAALRAAADGTYGFSVCVMPLEPGERSVADAIVALLPDARVAIATDDAAVLPERLPEGFISFPRADFRAGRLPRAWLDALARPETIRPEIARSDVARPVASPTTDLAKSRSDATRRLRSVAIAHRATEPDARASLVDELAWYRASGIGFALIIVRVPGSPQVLVETAAASLRAGDSVAVADSELAIIVPAVDARQAEQLCARVVKQILKGQRHLKTHDVKTGIAVCPHDGESVSALLASARERA